MNNSSFSLKQDARGPKQFFLHIAYFFMLEIGLATIVLSAIAGLNRLMNLIFAILIVFSLVGLCLSTKRVRKTLRLVIRRSHARERMRYAILCIGQDEGWKDLPSIKKCTITPHGWIYRLSLPSGINHERVKAALDSIGTHLHATEILLATSKRLHEVEVSVLFRDPFESVSTDQPEPDSEEHPKPVAVGVDESGQDVVIDLNRGHILLGGLTGSGKSMVQSNLLVSCALDPNCIVYLFDGKGVEFPIFQPIAKCYVTDTMNLAVEAMEDVRTQMKLRQQYLSAQRRRNLCASDPFQHIYVFIDELGYYLSNPEKKATNEFTTSITDVVARGRAFGISVIAATQRPSVDIVPATLRDNFSTRLAMRTMTKDSSDTILGSGMASAGYNSANVPGDQAGVGFLLYGSEKPIRFRCYKIDNSTLQNAGDSALEIRGIR